VTTNPSATNKTMSREARAKGRGMSDLDHPKGHADLKALANQLRRPLDTLYALDVKNDPYMAEMPSRLVLARWFAQLYAEFNIKFGVHIRAILYLLVSQPVRVLLPNGEPFENTTECYDQLSVAARDARYLDLIPANAIVDRRNPAPTINRQDYEDGEAEIFASRGDISTHSFGDSYKAPTLNLPTLSLCDEPVVWQRYLIEIWIEKSTANDVLMPLGREYDINIVTAVGEMSSTACENVVKRAIASGRPVRIIYISDFDPAGRSMPVAAAVKIGFLADKSGVELDIQVIPVALTPEQCIERDLPRTPIKDTEKRADKFEARWGRGATELDALEALYPDLLRQILVTEIERFYDSDLDDNVAEAVSRFREELNRVTSEVRDLHSDELAALNEQRSAIDVAFERVHGPAQAAHDDATREAMAAYYRALAQARVARDEALEPARVEIAEMEQRFMENAEPVIVAMNAEIQDVAPGVMDGFECPESAEAYDDDSLYDSKRFYVDQVDLFRKHQGEESDVRLARDRVISKMCTECGTAFSSSLNGATICSYVCSNKRGYRGRLERRRQAAKPEKGQKSAKTAKPGNAA
jgi:hypothetical protein